MAFFTFILKFRERKLKRHEQLFADRGFTGHEYLSWYKLYNMNGRLYDPAVGRFLSADPVIQNPGNSQNYNRYSYCLNNPLKYADPSGYQWMKKMAFQLYSNGEDSYRGMSSWGGGGAPSNTPHIDRMLQESMNQDASGGWRWDETTGTYDNIFSGNNDWDNAYRSLKKSGRTQTAYSMNNPLLLGICKLHQPLEHCTCPVVPGKISSATIHIFPYLKFPPENT